MVIARWRPLYPGSRCDAELVVRANGMRVEERGPRPSALLGVDMGELFADFWRQHEGCILKGRNKIVASICPQARACGSERAEGGCPASTPSDRAA